MTIDIAAIKARRAAADMVTILEAVSTYPLHKMADAYFAEFVGEDIDALLAEVDALQAEVTVLRALLDMPEPPPGPRPAPSPQPA